MAAELAELPAGDVHVFAPGPAKLEHRDVDGRGITIHWLEAGDAFGWPGFAARLRENPWRLGNAARFVVGARLAVARFAPERVVAHWALPSAWPIAPRSMHLDIVSHGADVRMLTAVPGRAQLVRALLRRAASWRFVSHSLLEELASSLPAVRASELRAFASVRAPTVTCAVDEHQAAALRASVGANPVYVAVGRLVPSKRVDRIVRHVAHAAPGATLVIVGDGPERAALESLAASRQVRAHFVGEAPRSEALAWIRAADCMLFASVAEGASCVLREAAALGTPVLAL